MYRELLPIWGPFSINSFGLFVAIGVLTMIRLIYRHPVRKKYLTDDAYYQLVTWGIISCIIGGKVLYAVQNWQNLEHSWEVFAFWQGGYSILGGILSCLVTVCLILKHYKVPILSMLDVISLYAPIAQGFGRIGCFFAGCCYGIVCAHAGAVTYTDPTSFAPLHIPLHPTQLYSAFSFFCLFFILRYVARIAKPGQVVALYIILSSLERFTIDFWRADREFIQSATLDMFSLHQWIALGMILLASFVLVITTFYYRQSDHHERI